VAGGATWRREGGRRRAEKLEGAAERLIARREGEEP
jgi:hypothetical protein